MHKTINILKVYDNQVPNTTGKEANNLENTYLKLGAINKTNTMEACSLPPPENKSGEKLPSFDFTQ